MSMREPQPLPFGASKPVAPPAPPPLHKLGTAGKDCCAEAAALLRSHREQERAEHFEEAATLVEAAGCICVALYKVAPLDSRFGCKAFWDSTGRLIEHDKRCPQALATMLREKGGHW